jgi:microsomal dipeptidase-like Zn-dependent dipeptidase
MIKILLILILFSSSSVYSERQFADLHNHMFGHEAWDGGWYHGLVEGPEHEALTPCSGNEDFFGDHGVVIHPWLVKIIFKSQDAGRHGKQGYPNYVTWPRWDTVIHQQMWEGHLKQAWKSGLRLMIVSFYGNQVICKLMNNKSRYNDCDDMNAVDRQFDAYEKFLQGHDENNKMLPLRSTWVVHASTLEEAKKGIKEGKLVVIPSIEVSNLFPLNKGPWREQLDKYYKRGIRTIQIVHQFNNLFAGAAIHEKILKVGQFFTNYELFAEKNGFNQLGLTTAGKELIKEMMKKKMLIDVAHLSEVGMNDVVKLTTSDGTYYPTYNSHTHVKSMMNNIRSSYEKSSPDDWLNYFKNAGGIVGLRTGADATFSFQEGLVVPNDCDGTSKSFAQSFLYLDKKLKIPFAFGSDFNGFATQMKPRFGKDSGCLKNQTNPLNKPFDETGYGHIGQIGNILDDLQQFGVDVTPLAQSAQTFLEMWDKVNNPKKRNKVIR